MTNRKQNDEKKDIVSALFKAFKSFGTSLPVMLGVILILELFRTFVSKQMLSAVFTGEFLRDTVIGALIGSISAGNPVNSYIIGGELVKENVSLIAITSFLVAWVTVGIIQYTYYTSYGHHELFCHSQDSIKVCRERLWN